MQRVLVLYPIEFLAKSKFRRKVGNIISRLTDVSLLFIDDPNGYIGQYSDASESTVQSESIQNIQDAKITHAIIFDDGAEFKKECAALKDMGIPVRVLNIAITRVVNINREKQYKNLKSTADYEYIGRGSYWGNPYSMFESNDEGGTDDRNEVIRKYKYDFDFDLFPNKDKNELLKLKGKHLGCFCKPAACHGDVLAEYLNSLDDGE